MPSIESASTQAVSLSQGNGVLDHPVQTTLTKALVRAAGIAPAKGVRYIRFDGTERLQTYPELLRDASRILGGLRRVGTKPGNKVLFQLLQNEDFVPAFWACILGGFVPVPVSIPPAYDRPHSALEKLRNAWTTLEKPIVLASESAVDDLKNFARREQLDGLEAQGIGRLRAESPDPDWHSSHSDEIALLLLTSGSTGRPKGVPLSHRNLIGRSTASAQMHGYRSTDVSLNWMPLDHVGGIVYFHIRDVCVALDQIHAPTELFLQNPLLWIEWIDRYRVNITWAANFAFGLINERADVIATSKWDLSCLRYVFNGGEAIVSRTARRFLALLIPHGLPRNAMKPAWGMSETSSGVIYGDRFTLETTSDDDHFVEIGLPIPGLSMRVVGSKGEILPEHGIGSLQVRGPTVIKGYHNDAKSDADAFTPDGWFITGDLGFIRDGRLSLTGREKDVIIINGVNFYSHELESLVEEIEGVDVSFTAACAIRMPGENTDQAGIFFCPKPGSSTALPELVKVIRNRVAQKGGLTPDFVVPLERGDIPKTAIGKIQRAQLRSRFEAGEFKRALARGLAARDRLALRARSYYRRTWREIEIPPEWTPAQGQWVVFADVLGLGDELVKNLRSKGCQCAIVIAGGTFARLDQDRFTIDPGNRRDYDRVWATLKAEHRPPLQTVHLWSYMNGASEVTEDTLGLAQKLGVQSLLFLGQVLAEATMSDERHRLWVVSLGAFEVRVGESIAFEWAAVPGILKTLPLEIPGLVASQVDMEIVSNLDQAFRLCREFCDPENNSEIAYRSGARLESRLERVDGSKAPGNLGLVKGGRYVVSGGAGGIGYEICRYLLSYYQAQLLIIGRSGPGAVEGPLKKLRHLGGDVTYVSCDIADLSGVEAALQAAEGRWSHPTDGIFHLAGTAEEHSLIEETQESFESSLHAKIAGAWALHLIARERPGLLVVHFSSLLAYFGGFRFGAYSAANSFLEGLTHHQRLIGVRSFCMMWSSWAKIGMSKGEMTEAMRAKGYLSLTPDEGIDSLNFALSRDHAHLLIGLDGANSNIRPHLDSPEEDVPPDETEHVEPRTSTELSLAAIWRDLLKRPRLSVRDNFFSIGGKSLLAARMFSQIAKVFGRNLPLATLFRAPTIEELAIILDEEATRPAACSLTPLRATGRRPPLFCLPGAGSDAIIFRGLAEGLSRDQPVYSLQSAGLDRSGGEDGLRSIEDIAAHFIREIRTVQPKGPFYLGGHCFGGLLAYEVAQQFMSQGEEVAVLAMIDAIASDSMPTMLRISLREKIEHHWAQMSGFSLVGKLGYVASKAFGYREARKERRREHESYARVEYLHKNYLLKPYPGSLTLFLASDSYFNRCPDQDPRLTWKRMALAGADVFVVGGGHATLLQLPFINDFSRKLDGILRDKQKLQSTRAC